MANIKEIEKPYRPKQRIHPFCCEQLYRTACKLALSSKLFLDDSKLENGLFLTEEDKSGALLLGAL